MPLIVPNWLPQPERQPEYKIFRVGDRIRFLSDNRGEEYWGVITTPVRRTEQGLRRQAVFWPKWNTETEWDPFFYRDPEEPVANDPIEFESYRSDGRLFWFKFEGQVGDDPPRWNMIPVTRV